MVKQMKKRFFIFIFTFLIVVDLIFISVTLINAFVNKDHLGQYFWFEKYASKIENDFSGQIKVNQILAGEIVFSFLPGTSPQDCYSVITKIHEWRQEDKRLDEINWIYFVADGTDGTKQRELLRVGLSQWGLAFSGLNEKDFAFDRLLISNHLSEEFYKLSSYRNIGDKFTIFTDTFIAFDDESVLTKITSFQCKEGLYTEEQLSEIEARGIPVTVWGEEASS